MRVLVRITKREDAIADQKKWIAEAGGTLEGYIARYGDPGVLTATGKQMIGSGGTAIYLADQEELRRLEAKRR